MLHVRASHLIIAGDRHSRIFFPWCMAMENIRCDVDENLWPDLQEQQDVHQEYFFSWMLFCIFVYLWYHSFFNWFGTIFISKVYIFKTLSTHITTDHQKSTFF